MEACVKEWLRRYREGDPDALGKLVEFYRRPLFSFLLRMTGSAGEVEDLFQEVWFRALRRLDRFRPDNLLGWLFSIAHNLVVDRARRARPTISLQAQTIPEGATLEELLEAPGAGPDKQAELNDLGRHIMAAVERLPFEQREVFLLRTQAGMPFKDIAALQGVSINTALARMQYALSKLRLLLQKEHAEREWPQP